MSTLRNIRPIERSRAWLGGTQSSRYKLSYFFNIVRTYLNFFAFRKRSVSYLGNEFIYDTKVTPLGLMLYPEEVGQLVETTGKIKTVLDIGGNIGQFSITLAHLLPKAKIDSFEPNPFAYKQLEFNAKPYQNIKTYCFGVGKRSTQTLFFSPNRSVNGSLIAKNATYRMSGAESKSVAVDIIDNISKITDRKKYDLIKVDVEGYEYQVIKNIRGVTTRYLYLEITGQARQKDYLHSELLNELGQRFGSFDILYTTRVSKSKFEALFEFK